MLSSQPVNPFYGQPCARDFTVTFRIGLTRCAHTLDSQGVPPSPAEIDSDAAKMYRDQRLLLAALTCCFPELFDLDPAEWALGAFEVQPVQGGCLFVTQDLLVRSSLCSDC